MAVIHRRPSSDGILAVSMYDEKEDSLDYNQIIEVRYQDVSLAEPQKRCKVMVIMGKNKGQEGIVKMIKGNSGYGCLHIVHSLVCSAVI
jgi:ribosomal protein S4E